MHWTLNEWIYNVKNLTLSDEELFFDNGNSKKLKVIFGESPYPSNQFVLTNYFGFSEVAFFNEEYKVAFVSILNILFGSTDNAIFFLKNMKLPNQNKFDSQLLKNFVYLLYTQENIILVNRNDINKKKKHIYRSSAITNILSHMSVALVVGKNHSTNIVRDLSKHRIYHDLIVHPSSILYGGGNQQTLSDYFNTYYEFSPSILSMFKIL